MAAAFGLPAAAQESGDSLQLRGVVPERTQITVSSNEATFPLEGEDEEDNGEGFVVDSEGNVEKVIANISIGNNSKTGYEVRVFSESAGDGDSPALRAEGASLPYSLFYGGREVRFVNGEAVLVNKLADSRLEGEVSSQELRLRAKAPPGQAGQRLAFQDSLTIVFRAK